MATYVSTINLLADGVCDRSIAFSDLGSLEYQYPKENSVLEP
ncbi:MAG: hypothetical protein PUP92_19350 [Rhizonema sp. PD38]|nr:hypothetical protein [Rhizonema sp. PD38]